MNPYIYTQQATERGESLLSLCCGIGFELEGLGTQNVTAVDIVPEYLETLKGKYPHVNTVLSDSLKYLKKQKDNSVDIISIIDGIEHLDKVDGLTLIRQMKRVAKKQILLFTPQGQSEDGFLRNEPHHAWDIPTGDKHQRHLSGWTLKELEELGFIPIKVADDVSQHGEPYQALMVTFYV